MTEFYFTNKISFYKQNFILLWVRYDVVKSPIIQGTGHSSDAHV